MMPAPPIIQMSFPFCSRRGVIASVPTPHEAVLVIERAIGTEATPRVFISYSWESDAHKACYSHTWYEQLGDVLMS